MAVMAVAAIASGGAVAAGLVTIQTVAMIGVGLSVVGAVTGNQTLLKIGAGMGIGSAGAGLAGLGTSTSPGLASAAASEASSAAVATEASAGLGASSAPAAATAIPTTSGITTSAPASAATAGAVPSSAAVAGVQSGIGAAGGVAQTANEAVKGLTGADDWFNSIGKLWSGLDTGGKLAVGQAGMGLVSGIGKGVLQGMSENDKMAAEKEQLNRQYANAGAVPTVNIGINPNYQPNYHRVPGLINQGRA